MLFFEENIHSTSFIRLGASINEQNSNNKYTALHYAVAGNNPEAIRALLECNAKTNIRNADVCWSSVFENVRLINEFCRMKIFMSLQANLHKHVV